MLHRGHEGCYGAPQILWDKMDYLIGAFNITPWSVDPNALLPTPNTTYQQSVRPHAHGMHHGAAVSLQHVLQGDHVPSDTAGCGSCTQACVRGGGHIRHAWLAQVQDVSHCAACHLATPTASWQ